MHATLNDRVFDTQHFSNSSFHIAPFYGRS
jgi:hypothetical protein